MHSNKEKEKINVLMNIDNYFGEHQGRLAPILVFLLVSASPFLVYTVMFSMYIPLKVMIVVEVIWTARMALLILGKENERLQQYIKDAGYEKTNEKEKEESIYENVNELVRVERVTEDGLIEYVNGQIAYIVSGFCMTYMDDVSFTLDFTNFLAQLRGYEYDTCCHMVVDEFKLQDQMEKYRVYTDREMIKERMEFYSLQDKYCKENSALYRISFVVKAPKYDWKNLKDKLSRLVQSEFSYVFKDLALCDKEMVEDIMSRDVCANVDLNKMLVDKFKNDEYYGSEVLFYGTEIPEEYKPKRDSVNMNQRRVVQGRSSK